jgi:hypothetical protein
LNAFLDEVEVPRTTEDNLTGLIPPSVERPTSTIRESVALEATFDVWDRAESILGRRALAPDNRYHNVSISIGADLPAESRINGTFSFGQLDQDERYFPTAFTPTSWPTALSRAQLRMPRCTPSWRSSIS